MFEFKRLTISAFKISLLITLLFSSVAITANAQDSSEEDSVLEEVLVTATYREASVQDLGLSIRAFGENEMNRLGITDISGLARFTPSLNIQERGPNRNEMNIRGVSNFLVTQDLVPSGRPVGSYLDESPVNTLGGSQFDVRLFDMQRVEVLRGPQGTLYGEGSSAGAVRYFSRSPSLSEFEGHVELEILNVSDGGSDGNLRAAIGIPLLEDKLGLRLVAATYNNPGFIDVIDGKNDVNDLSAKMFRAVLLAEASENVTIRAMVHYDDSKLGSLGLYSGDVADRSVNLPLDDARVDDESLVANLKIDWRAASGTFTSLSSYFDRDRKRDSYDQINSVVNSLVTAPFFGFFDESFAKDRITQDQFSQEFRYVSQFDGSFQFTAGAFYKDFTFETRDVDVCTDTNLILGLPDRCTAASLEALGFSVADVAISNTGEQLSAFFELEYAFTDRLKLIGGLRWHNEDLEAFSPETTTLLGFSPFPLPEVSQKVTIDKILPMVALDFRVNDDILTYGKYSTGARNGNINSTATLALMEIFAPGSTPGFESYGEDSTGTFEVGMKSQFADGRVTFNAAAWYTDYSDLQVVVAVPPLGFGLILNASEASSKGVEFDLFASPTDNLTLFGGGSYVSSELDADLVTNLLTGAVTPKGTALPFAPKWSWSGGAEYIWPMQSGLDFYLNGNFSYTGKMKNSLAADSLEIGDFWLLGAGLGVRADQWSLDLLVTNLTDESEPVAINNFDALFEDNVGPLPDGFTFNEQFMIQPRTIRLTLRYRF